MADDCKVSVEQLAGFNNKGGPTEAHPKKVLKATPAPQEATERWTAAQAAVVLLETRGSTYKATNHIVASVLLSFEELGAVSRTEIDAKAMAIFDAAIVRLTQFVVSDCLSVESIINFAGYMNLLSYNIVEESHHEVHHAAKKVPSRQDILREIHRNCEIGANKYSDVYPLVGEILRIYEGGTYKTIHDFFICHNFELLITKLARFYNSGLTHRDSLVDIMGYTAIIGAYLSGNHHGTN